MRLDADGDGRYTDPRRLAAKIRELPPARQKTALGNCGDAVAVQFSVKAREWADRPYFIYGQIDDPVNLWRYRADNDSIGPAAGDTTGSGD